MRKLLAGGLLVGLVSLAVVAWGSPQDAPKIEGNWTVVGGSSGDKKITEELAKQLMMTAEFKDGKYALSIMGKAQESGTYKVDGSKKPATIDLSITEGTDKGKMQLGILKLEGDQLALAFAKAGSKERPKNFAGGEGVELVDLKRKK